MASKSSLLFLFSLLIVLTSPLRAAMTDQEALAAANQFLADPFKGAPADILQFAEESPSHEITIDPKYLPWISDPHLPPGHQLLLAAFVAGDIREQITKGTSKSEPYAGILAVIEVYKKIQARKPSFVIPAVDHFIELEKQGKLKEHFTS